MSFEEPLLPDNLAEASDWNFVARPYESLILQKPLPEG